jgi:hypothetical protein
LEERETRLISEIVKSIRESTYSLDPQLKKELLNFAVAYFSSYSRLSMRALRNIFIRLPTPLRDLVRKNLKYMKGKELLLGALEDEAELMKIFRKARKMSNAYEWRKYRIMMTSIDRVRPIIRAWKLVFGSIPKIVYVPHHLAHAASAYYTSGLSRP